MPEIVNIVLGRRKSSVARVRFVKGKGKIIINDREVTDYFKRPSLVMELQEPLSIVDFDNKMAVVTYDTEKVTSTDILAMIHESTEFKASVSIIEVKKEKKVEKKTIFQKIFGIFGA